MENLERRISEHLHDQREHIPVAADPIVDIEHRGVARRRRTNAGIAVVSALALVAAIGLGSLAFREAPASIDDMLDVASGSTAADDGGGDATATATVVAQPTGGTLSWTLHEGTLASWVDDHAIVENTFYVLSTAPGVKWEDYQTEPLPRAIYASTNPGEWKTTEFGDDLYPTSMAANPFGLYVVGTAPGTAGAPIDLQVGTSTDGGASFDVTTLRLAATEPDLTVESSANTFVNMASTDTVAAILAVTDYWVDYAELLPNGARSGDEISAEPTDEGVVVYDYSQMDELEEACAEAWEGLDSGAEPVAATAAPTTAVAATDDASTADSSTADGDENVLPECAPLFEGPEPIASYTWDELGHDPASTHFVEMFVAGDGGEFEAVAAPPIGNVAHFGTMGPYLVASGFPQRAGFEPVSADVWLSTDGRAWERAANVPPLDWITTTGNVGDTLVMSGYVYSEAEEGGSAVFASTDGGSTWREVSIPMAAVGDGLATDLSVVGVGRLGLVALVIEYQDEGRAVRDDIEFVPPNHSVVYSTDLESWTLQTLSEAGAPDNSFPGGVVLVGDSRISVGGATFVTDGPEPYCCGSGTSWELVGTTD